MAKTRPQLTAAQREQRHAHQRDLMTAAVEQLRSSDGWRAYLNTRAAFRSYSPRNVLLIMLQHPTATRVAGFRAWLKLGYCVRKGETAIRIWAPCPPSHKQLDAWRQAGADPQQHPHTHWRLAAVFAQDQVTELPPPPVPAPLAPPTVETEGDSHADLLAELSALAGEINYRFEIANTGAAEGVCHRHRRLIEVAERLEPNGQLAAGIHELAHALVGENDLAGRLTYAEEELVVESVAYCVSQTVGLDVANNSIPYLASWAERASLEILERTARLTGQIADRIEAALLADINGTATASAAA